MTALTPRDKLPYPLDANETVGDLDSWLRSLALATQVALDKRQQGTYVWVDDDARGLQTGMKQSDEGYVLATKTWYVFDGGVWRLATPHMEFSAVKGAVANSTLYTLGSFAVDVAASTSTSIATAGADGVINIVDPGLYAISTVTQLRAASNPASPTAATGRTFLDMATASGIADLQRVSIVTGEDRGSMASPNVRVTSPNQPIWFQAYRNVVGSEVNGQTLTRVRITRLA